MKRFFGIIIFLTVYQFISYVTKSPILVGLPEISAAFLKALTDFDNLLSTLKIVFLGVSIASVFGVIIGVLMALYKILPTILMSLVEFIRNIPAISLFPLLIVLLGIGDQSRIFVIFWAAWPPVLLQTLYALNNTDKSLLEAAADCGADKYVTMWRIQIPLALPQILNGVRVAFGNGFVAVVVAEMLGASKGLGYMIQWCSNSFNYSGMFAYILMIGLIGLIINSITAWAIKQYEKELV